VIEEAGERKTALLSRKAKIEEALARLRQTAADGLEHDALIHCIPVSPNLVIEPVVQLVP
jgi:hypothetical protein